MGNPSTTFTGNMSGTTQRNINLGKANIRRPKKKKMKIEDIKATTC